MSYGVPFNGKSVSGFVYEVERLWIKSLRRRSQRQDMDWIRFKMLIRRWIPSPKVVHPYPEQRFRANHLRWEPDALAAHIQICAGAGGNSSSYHDRPHQHNTQKISDLTQLNVIN